MNDQNEEVGNWQHEPIKMSTEDMDFALILLTWQHVLERMLELLAIPPLYFEDSPAVSLFRVSRLAKTHFLDYPNRD